MKICDFDRQFLSFSYLLRLAQNDTKNMSFNSYDPDHYDYAKITFIHPVINAQSHAKFGLSFFETPCIIK